MSASTKGNAKREQKVTGKTPTITGGTSLRDFAMYGRSEDAKSSDQRRIEVLFCVFRSSVEFNKVELVWLSILTTLRLHELPILCHSLLFTHVRGVRRQLGTLAWSERQQHLSRRQTTDQVEWNAEREMESGNSRQRIRFSGDLGGPRFRGHSGCPGKWFVIFSGSRATA